MHLNYIIDENDIESQKALNDVTKDAPKAEVISDMQATLARVLQSQTPPMTEGGNTAQAINQSSMWQ
jgi:hypothetical protein